MKPVTLTVLMLSFAAIMGGQANTTKFPKATVDSWTWIKPGIGTVKAQAAQHVRDSEWKLKKVEIDNGASLVIADEADFNGDTFEADVRGNVRVTLRKQSPN